MRFIGLTRIDWFENTNAMYKAPRAIGKIVLVFVYVAMLFLALPSNAKVLVSATKGDKLYTKFSLFQEDNTHLTTNYRKGLPVPINTEVTFVKSSSDTITVKLADGRTLKI